ncbi:MAG TPA: DUF4124 domain-containing protein [Spongiibacteraceae bacterium]|nr:DUF4124 domain-containing protein [Spongiibacteraceae bacterium]
MRTIICVCLLVCAAAVWGDVYRWVDSEGRTHYSDHAPSAQHDRATRVSIQAAPASLDPEAEQARQQMRSIDEARQRERAFTDQKAMEERQRRAELARRCQALQNEIRDDRNTAIFYRCDDAGKRVLWTHEERLAYRERLQNLKQSYCPDLSD